MYSRIQCLKQWWVAICCNMGYHSENYLEHKSCKISFSSNLSLSCFGILDRAWQWYCQALGKISKPLGIMGLLPDTQNCWCACAGNAGNVFPVTAGARSRHASRHVRHARAVMHVGIANLRFPLKSAAGENVPGIPGACATRNFTYLVRGPYLNWLLITK